MVISYTLTFKRQYKKLPKKFQEQFAERLELFLTDRTDLRLRVHPLKGNFKGYWSMNVNGDIRALYRDEGDELVIFALIGTHSELYG
jgi:addiction module RelE/StbE family toxin